MTIKFPTRDDLLRKGINGEKITKEEVLAMYADPKNWETLYINGRGCRWVWKGPVTCGYEAAQWALEEKP